MIEEMTREEAREWVLVQARMSAEIVKALDHARIDLGLTRAKFIERLVLEHLKTLEAAS